MIKVVIADSHPIIQFAIEHLFRSSSEINIVAQVSNTTQLFEFLERETAHLVLLEMDIPEVNGITALRKMKKEHPDVKTIMFSGQPEDVYAISALKAGAAGYLSKTVDPKIISEAILKIAKGGIYISNELAQRLAFDESTNRPRRFFRRLSTREVEVLKLMSTGKRNKHIAEELGLNEKTVSTYKARLFKKLNVTNLIDLVNQGKHMELT